MILDFNVNLKIYKIKIQFLLHCKTKIFTFVKS